MPIPVPVGPSSRLAGRALGPAARPPVVWVAVVLCHVPQIGRGQQLAQQSAEIPASPPQCQQNERLRKLTPPQCAEFWRLYGLGAALKGHARFREAIDALQRSYDLAAEPRALFAIAGAWAKLGEWQACIDSYQRYAQEMDVPRQADVSREVWDGFLAHRAEVELSIRVCHGEREKAKLALEHQTLLQAAGARRPMWRIALGSALLGTGLLTAGFGIPALAISGRCFDSSVVPPQVCPTLYDTTPLGLALTLSGAGLLVAGAVTIAAPPARPARPANADRNATIGMFAPTSDAERSMPAQF